MPIRTKPGAVLSVLLREYDTVNNPSLGSFIDLASNLTDQVQANDCAGLLTASGLELIERLLAAHFYQIGDPGYTSRSTGGASGSFNGQQTQTLKGTRYGQQAMLMDSTGFLERRDKEVEEGGRRRIQVYCPTEGCE